MKLSVFRPSFQLKNKSGYRLIHHAVLLVILIWGLNIQEDYQVSTRFWFLALGSISCIFILICFFLLTKNLLVFMVTHFFRETPWMSRTGAPAGAGFFYPIERFFNVVSWMFVLSIGVFYLNGHYDPSAASDKASEVLDLVHEELHIGVAITNTWVVLRSWDEPGEIKKLYIREKDRALFWRGEPVRVEVHPGFLNLPWVSGIEKDEAQLALGILKLFPTATSARKNLINDYIQRRNWKEAALAMKDYLQLNPADYDYLLYVSGIFAGAFHDAEAIPFLEYVIARHPTYKAYLQLGEVLHNVGNNRRAAEVLEASKFLNAKDWTIYYVLGMAYYDMGDFSQSLSNFEKVLEIRPRYPEVESLVAGLKKKVTLQQAKQ